MIIGFRVRPNLNARRLAERENVDIRNYKIIYDATKDIHNALEGMLAPGEERGSRRHGRSEGDFQDTQNRNDWRLPGAGWENQPEQPGRLIRDGIQIYEGPISSLKRFKDDVREVESGFECGIGLEGYNDLKVGDVIEAFKVVETKRKLTT